MKTKRILAITLLSALPLHAKGLPQDPRVAAPAPEVDPPKVDPAPAQAKVQIALLLDTSNSMDGLIDQARTQLWKVVNTFVDARRDGAAPFVEVALYEYGNNSLHVGNNYIRQVEPLTRDLDELSRELFALKTNGGEEYSGAVIQRALADLSWDPNEKTYKAIFIAGNEPFTQGPVDPRQACKDALAKHIVVNTIHCGTRDEGIAGSWHDGAALAEGKFMIIDQDKAVAHIDAPQDKRISDLSQQLNKTYIGYGKTWAASAANQSAADKDATANAKAGAEVSRAVTKASANYNNGGWDLVDATREKKVDLAKLPVAELPAELRDLKPEERAAYVEKAARDRAAIQTEILELNKQREAHVAAELKKQATAGAQTLDEALVETTRSQATALGYTFGN
ncbi:MAG: VWA domain-containing protein [Verrucomicrobiaceae bacterium]|nr:MAG: VWA domain-containing protein [Verrucomicrobiaceae bacterium]